MNQADSDGDTPILLSSMQGHQEVVELLLANGADVNQASNNGATPLITSSQNGHEEAVELLLVNVADVNQAGNDDATPLIGTSSNGHYDIAELLLKSGAAANHAMNGSVTALSAAVNKGHIALVPLLRLWRFTIPRRLATYAGILYAIELEEGRATQEEPVKELLQLLAKTPDDIVRVIVMFLGDGGAAEE